MVRYLALAIVLTLLVTQCIAHEEKVRKHKKFRKPHMVHHMSTKNVESSEMDMLAQDEEAELREKEEARRLAEQIRLEERAETNNVEPQEDPCGRVHCGAGRVCQLTEDNTPRCICIPECPEEKDLRRHVCTNHNETWGSDCAIYQHRCWCNEKDPRCKGENYKHVHIEYYGVCRDMPDCTKEEMDDFPRRMRDWLFNVMRDLADRHELSPHYLKMEREAETNMTKRWANAVVWKWCDLDGHPHDRSVSRHELFPIRAPLMSLEHCIAPFLDSCDLDDDHRISLNEWTSCLKLDEDDIEDKCEDIDTSSE